MYSVTTRTPAEFSPIGSGRNVRWMVAGGRQVLLQPGAARRRARARGSAGERSPTPSASAARPSRSAMVKAGASSAALHDQETLERLAREDRRRHRRAATGRDVARQERRRDRHEAARGDRSPHRVQRGEQPGAGARVAHAAQRPPLLGQEQVGVGDLRPEHRDRRPRAAARARTATRARRAQRSPGPPGSIPAGSLSVASTRSGEVTSIVPESMFIVIPRHSESDPTSAHKGTLCRYLTLFETCHYVTVRQSRIP